MKRFHVHTRVADLQASIDFYSRMFGAAPSRLEADYAKWMLEDPRVNFAISARGGAPGIDHLGFQADNTEELATLKERAQSADAALLDEGHGTCCYARSEKHWVTDPSGIAWENFHTLENIPVFNEGATGVSAGGGAAAAAAVVASAATPSVAAESLVPAACAPARGKPIGIAVKSAGSCC